MGIKKDFLTVLILFGIFSGFLATCRKSEEIRDAYSYTFKGNWNVTPAFDSIAVGDTIIVSSDFPLNMFDYNSNRNVDFKDEELIGTPMTVRAIRGINSTNAAVDSFSFITETGRCETDSRQPSYIKQLYWEQTANKYQVKFKMIARKKGSYFLTLIDALSKGKDGSAIILLSNNNFNNHAYQLGTYFGGPVPANDSSVTYSFRVH